MNKGVRWDSFLEKTVNAEFIGCDGRRYQIHISGDQLHVNGVCMLDWEDRPCEYANECHGSNGNCSYKRRDLSDEKLRCTIYDDKKRRDDSEQ